MGQKTNVGMRIKLIDYTTANWVDKGMAIPACIFVEKIRGEYEEVTTTRSNNEFEAFLFACRHNIVEKKRVQLSARWLDRHRTRHHVCLQTMGRNGYENTVFSKQLWG